MARELHDGVLSRMFGTRMNLDNLNEQTGEENVKKRAFFINDLKEIEKEIREMSHNLSAVNQKFNNFVQIVVNLLEEQKETHKVDVVYSIDKDINWNLIENETKINLFRILQESLQNTNKYANATQIDVAFSTEQNNLQLTYQDNGDGFDVNKKKKGIGLKNMYGRAEESNGKLEITSEIGKGTQLKLSVPYNATT